VGRFEPLPTDPYQRAPGQYGAICAACSGETQLGAKFCTSCDALRDDAERGHTVRYAASRWVRLGARLLDALIVGLLGMIVFVVLDAAGFVDIDLQDQDTLQFSDINVSTLIATGIWFLWFAAVAPRGQTPGKQILRIQIINADGSQASTWLNWRREGLFQFFVVAPSLFGEPIISPPDAVTQLLGFLVFLVLLSDASFIFAGTDKQTIHDRLFRTLVVRIRPVRQHSAELCAL